MVVCVSKPDSHLHVMELDRPSRSAGVMLSTWCWGPCFAVSYLSGGVVLCFNSDSGACKVTQLQDCCFDVLHGLAWSGTSPVHVCFKGEWYHQKKTSAIQILKDNQHHQEFVMEGNCFACLTSRVESSSLFRKLSLFLKKWGQIMKGSTVSQKWPADQSAYL